MGYYMAMFILWMDGFTMLVIPEYMDHSLFCAGIVLKDILFMAAITDITIP